MRLKSLILLSSIILVIVAGAVSGFVKKSDYVHWVISLTSWQQLKPCAAFFPERENFDIAVSCGEKVKIHNEGVNIPRCFVIPKESADVRTVDEGKTNVVVIGLLYIRMAILGFFDDKDNSIYLVENSDIDYIYIHEIGHYILQLAYKDGDGRHLHQYWQTCATPTYDRTNKREIK